MAIELLSPAGDPKKLRIALAYGADAVYGGVSHFSLRIRSGKEFTYETFQEGVDYAHSLEKKFYATINGFPFNSQLSLVRSHIEKIAATNVDAIIVSTPGVIKMCREVAPHIPLHLSTQANVLNYLDAEVYYEMGVRRIIAAREVGLTDLIEIKKHLPEMEIEIFVHGSMCFAYSGRCLISSLQMGRVPNRGSCANDCRLPYEVYVKNPEHDVLMRVEENEEGSFIFNAKDLCLIDHIPELLASGAIDSLKIEGRTKSDYYAAVATKGYRYAIDGNAEAGHYEIETLKRRGYSDNYVVAKPFERTDTQNLETAISEGSHQVHAEVDESGTVCFCKGQLFLGYTYEIVAPYGFTPIAINNDIGEIFTTNGRWFLRFTKIITPHGKEFNEIHSGNIHPVLLPSPLPPFTFLRKEIDA